MTTKINQKLKKTIKKHLFVYSLIIIQLIFFTIFYVYVNFNSIAMAFQWIDTSGETTWSLNAFRMFFKQIRMSDGEIRLALINTFIYFGVSLALIVVGFFTSYFLYKKVAGHKFFRVLFFFPGILSAIVWSMIYKQFLGVQGPIPALIQAVFRLEQKPELLGDSKYALTWVIVYSFWLGIPANFILLGGAMARIPDSIIEAAKIDGIGWVREVFNITLPLIWPTGSTILLLSLTGLFSASGNLLLLTGGEYNTNSISFLIFKQVYGQPGASNTYNYGSSVGIFFTLLTIPIVFLTRFIINRVEDVQY